MKDQRLPRKHVDVKKVFLLAVFVGITIGIIYCKLLLNSAWYASSLIKWHHRLVINLGDGTEVIVNTTTTSEDSREAYHARVESDIAIVRNGTSRRWSAKEDGRRECRVDATSPRLRGEIHVDKSRVNDVELLRKRDLGFVRKGGRWHPDNNYCQHAVKVAVVVPFRDRRAHLFVFLRHIHPILRRQQLNYQIFIVNQTDASKFNRGKLMNVGYKEAMRRANFSCVVFHDIDLLPMNDRNLYGCDVSPKHMAPLVDKLGFTILYESLFGGVEALTSSHFETVNGFSNAFWGWGAEDDNLFERIKTHKLQMWRPSQRLGKYAMLDHKDRSIPMSVDRRKDLADIQSHMSEDGLSDLQYRIVSSYEESLYTVINVDLRKEKDRQILGRDVLLM